MTIQKKSFFSDGISLSLSHSSAPHSFNKVLGLMGRKAHHSPNSFLKLVRLERGSLLTYSLKLGNPSALHLCGFVSDADATRNREGEDVDVALDFPTRDFRFPSKNAPHLVFIASCPWT